MNLIIQVKDVDIYQKQRKVLENVNIDIKKGEFVYLVGKTGSGKSSLLKTLYADLPLQKGNIDIADYKLHQIQHKETPFLRRKLGIIFQDFQLFYDRSIAENLLFVLRATGWKDKKEMAQRVAEVLQKVGLSGMSQKMPYQISGGEQQRVAIARALLNNPLVVLADEPTGNLDPEVSREILKLFLEINREGTAILMATHNYDLLDYCPARTLQCLNGKVV
jgi:cell division transport system ATP-binding protein